MESTQFEIETLLNPSALRDELQVKPLHQNALNHGLIDLTADETYWSERVFVPGPGGDSPAPTCLKNLVADALLWANAEQNHEDGCFKGGDVVISRRGESDQTTGGSEVNCLPAVDESSVLLRGDEIGDAPTQYQVAGLRLGELPVIGTYVDRRIAPGFNYTVRLLGSRRHMFEGRALPLLTVGKGYGKRITFKGDSHNVNQNYFWSDSNPEGCAFSLVAVERGDRFSIYDEQSRPVGSAVIDSVEPAQVEMSTQTSGDGALRKRARVTFSCEVHFGGQPHGIMSVCSESVFHVSGTAVLVKPKRQREATLEVIEGIDLPFHGQCVFYKEE